jgi:hypothetical protein
MGMATGGGVPAGPMLPRRRAGALAPAIAPLVALILFGAGAVLAPPPALASCAGVPLPPDEAVFFGDVVFVGTVLRTENEGRWATVRVEERWKGSADLAETIVVRGGPGPGTATSVDRTYAPGRYLFIVERAAGEVRDSACGSTQPWTDELAALRPPTVSPAAAELPTDPLGAIEPGTIALVAALAGALLIAVVAYLWVLRARRRPPDWMR